MVRLVWGLLLLLLAHLCVSMVIYSDTTECISVNDNCVIHTSNGVVDLRPLDANPGPRFENVVGQVAGDQYSFEYSYNPCTAFTASAGAAVYSDCDGVAVCGAVKSVPADSRYLWDLGRHATVSCGSDPDRGLYLEYAAQKTHDSVNRTSQVFLVCNETTTTPRFDPITFAEPTAASFQFLLTSQHACVASGVSTQGMQNITEIKDKTTMGMQTITHPGLVTTVTTELPTIGPALPGGGLSAGSIICITAVCMLAVYIFGGILIKATQTGATGIERIPNIGFWKELPDLISDGAEFTKKTVCCQQSASSRYENI